jgi:hypothetical protein
LTAVDETILFPMVFRHYRASKYSTVSDALSRIFQFKGFMNLPFLSNFMAQNIEQPSGMRNVRIPSIFMGVYSESRGAQPEE